MEGTSLSTIEIVESTEEVDSESKVVEKTRKNLDSRLGNRYAIGDDINQLFEAINIRNSSGGPGSCHDVSRESLQRSAMKRPIRVSSAQASGIGISEPLSLKQALRGLCISQASEMAAMKRLSRLAVSSRGSDAGTTKRLYREVAIDSDGQSIPDKEGKGNLVQVSLIPEKISLDHLAEASQCTQVSEASSSDHALHPSIPLTNMTIQDAMTEVLPTKDHMVSFSPAHQEEKSLEPRNSTSGVLSHITNNQKTVCEGDIDSEALDEALPVATPLVDGLEGKFHAAPSQTGFSTSVRVSKIASSSPRLLKPIFRNRSFIKKKARKDLTSASASSSACNEKVGSDLGPCTSDCGVQNGRKGTESASPASSSNKTSVEVNSGVVDTRSDKLGIGPSCGNRNKLIVTEADEKSRSRGKGDFSQSSKSSIGDYSSTTSVSEESYLSGSSRSGNRPHMSKDFRWEAVRSVQKRFGTLGLSQFKLLRRIGSGDIGTVYLAELIGTSCQFALKVMDNEFLVSRKKLARAETERGILQMLDHPFLPTLYAHFTTDKLSCLVMEYCPGGDLHVLRQKQPSKSFSEQAARFYVAEVLLALEYLHMLGVVYRDLKPENILVREDGHIMLTDFDLSLRCAVSPMLVRSSSPVTEPTKNKSSPCTDASCIDPFCLHPSWQVSCFTPRILSIGGKPRKRKSDLAAQISPLPELIVEPTGARSNSFVGTHEYLAPEIIKGEGHGSAVDWWTFGIFLFELLYGKTPFKGSGNEETLTNVVSQSLRFPSSPIVSFHARDLIRGLLMKEPENRLGSSKGAADIKQHPFFEGLNWALIRCARPPELPNIFDIGIATTSQRNESTKCDEFKSIDEDIEFEMF